MAVYFDHKVQIPYTGQHVDAQWHKSFPLLAVLTQSDPMGGISERI
jgi:hypothetical protein